MNHDTKHHNKLFHGQSNYQITIHRSTYNFQYILFLNDVMYWLSTKQQNKDRTIHRFKDNVK